MDEVEPTPSYSERLRTLWPFSVHALSKEQPPKAFPYERARSEPIIRPPSTRLMTMRRLSELFVAKIPIRDSPLSNEIPMSDPSSSSSNDDAPSSPSPYACAPPSPTPTELVIEEEPVKAESQSVILARYNIKVRDYAFDPDPASPPAPVISNPVFDLMEYDNILFELPRARPVPGRTLRRLLDVGWVTKEDSERDWMEMDWQSLREFDAKGTHRWRPSKADKPSEKEREDGRWQRARVLGTLRGRIRPSTPATPPPSVHPENVNANVNEPKRQATPVDKGKKRAHSVESMEEDAPSRTTAHSKKRSKRSPSDDSPRLHTPPPSFPCRWPSVTPPPPSSEMRKTTFPRGLTRTLAHASFTAT